MPSKSYINPETSTTWADSGGDKLLDLGGLAAGSAAMGAYLDLGVAPRADIYEIEVFIDGFDSAPAVGETIDVYVSQSSDGTNFDGEPTTAPTNSTQGTITTAQAVNCQFVGSLVVYSITAGDKLRGRFVTRLTSRYVAPVIINRSAADPLLSSADAHRVILTPIPQEMQ